MDKSNPILTLIMHYTLKFDNDVIWSQIYYFTDSSQTLALI